MLKPNLLPRYQRRFKQWQRRSKARGLLVYRGPSTMPGLSKKTPVIGAVSFYCSNLKVGDEFQTWHFNAKVHPIEARRGHTSDACVCGEGANACPFVAAPGDTVGACYPAGRTLNGIWSSIQRGNYPELAELAAELRLPVEATLAVVGSVPDGVRLGAYGDPVAMPAAIAQHLTRSAQERQGFTHQWRQVSRSAWPRLVMASCELPEQVGQAAALGWRTYTAFPPELTRQEARRAIINASGKAARLILAGCPATYAEGIDCAGCPIQCNGVERGRPWHVINAAHGAAHIMRRYNALGYLERWRAYL